MRTEGSPEQSLRRVLKAAGYRMRKSRAPISSDNLGGYMIVDMSGNAVAPTFLRFCAPSVQAESRAIINKDKDLYFIIGDLLLIVQISNK